MQKPNRVLLILAGIFAVGVIFALVYAPLTSRLIAEIPITKTVQEQQVTFTQESSYYADIHARRGKNAVITVSVANESWSDQIQIPINRTNKSQRTWYSVFGQEKLPFAFPETGMYTVTISLEGDAVSIKKIKIFERN